MAIKQYTTRSGDLTGRVVVESGVTIEYGDFVGVDSAKNTLSLWVGGTATYILPGLAIPKGAAVVGDGTLECEVDWSGVVIENITVIHAGTENDLRMHLNIIFIEISDFFQDIIIKIYSEHEFTRFGFGHVYRYIKGTEPLSNDSFEFFPRSICQGYKVTMQEGETIISVSEIKREPHSGRELVNIAENTFVATRFILLRDK